MKNDILIYSFLFLGMLFTDLSSSNQGMATLLMISVILACLAITLKIDNDKIELTVNKKLFLAMMEYCGLISVLVSLYCIKQAYANHMYVNFPMIFGFVFSGILTPVMAMVFGNMNVLFGIGFLAFQSILPLFFPRLVFLQALVNIDQWNKMDILAEATLFHLSLFVALFLLWQRKNIFLRHTDDSDSNKFQFPLPPIRHLLFFSSVVASLLFRFLRVQSPVDFSASFAAMYTHMAYTDLGLLPMHMMFVAPCLLLALSSTERALAIMDNRVLILGRLGGKRAFSKHVLGVLAKDIVLYGLCHVLVMLTISLINHPFTINGYAVLLMIRILLLNGCLSIALLAVAAWAERTMALLAWFLGSCFACSAGLLEFMGRSPSLYRFNLFVSCMWIDDCVYKEWLAMPISFLAMLAGMAFAYQGMMKGEGNDD